MAFTYDISTDLGKVRWRVGDTEDAGHLLEDAEINAVLSDTANLDAAAVRCCEAILAKLGKRADRSVVGINTSRSQQFTQYKDLLAELRARVSLGGGGMTAHAGGVSRSRNTATRQDSDFNAPPFAVGQDSNPPQYDEAADE